MGLKRAAPAPALVVPDEETWLGWSNGLTDARLAATTEPGRARVLLLPERVPHGLVAAVQAAWAEMPPDKAVELYAAPLHGVPAAAVLAGGDDARDGDDGREPGHDSREDSGHEGHGDMMAITGKPSADGLVMENLDVEAGPLGVALPGGLVVTASLDGDVVATCEVHQTLQQDAGASAPDPLSAVAWSVAHLAAEELAGGAAARPAERWLRLAAVEVERMVSHLGWLHRFCRLLGWPLMTERVRAGLLHVAPAHETLGVDGTTRNPRDDSLRDAVDRLRTGETTARVLLDDLSSSRLLSRRTAGLGRIDADEARRRGLTGPVGRASGVVTDARAGDPGYRELGFEPTIRDAGDTRARLLTRVEEAATAARLAAAAIQRASSPDRAADARPFEGLEAAAVESARGPVRVLLPPTGAPERTASGARAARELAGELAVGREWAAALVTVASFDLSPWQVAP